MSPTGRGREWLILGKSVADAMRVRNAQSWVNGGADRQGWLEGGKKSMKSGGFKLHPSIELDIRFWGFFCGSMADIVGGLTASVAQAKACAR